MPNEQETSITTSFDALLCEVSARLEVGERIDLQQIAAEAPEHLDRLRKLLPTLQAMAEVGRIVETGGTGRSPFPEDVSPRGTLGDYQIVKEIGRGGMGVVYEAEQISLARRVALKVLPFAAVMDPRQLARFKNEAQAAATLDHPNIVSVYAIGCDRSVHYFAMQYIAGQTLAEVISDLRQRNGLAGPNQSESGTISYLLTGGSDSKSKLPAVEPPSRPAPASAPTARPPQAAISTQRATSATAFFHSVARLGIQAAEALDHAHQHGILHRDIKPGNLMLDTTGKLWVTDFGLARIEGDASMTMTGDLLGTMRYMSPEQALAKRVVVDHRSDIYSLGVTLYELLTLRPAFAGEDRHNLLRQIAFDEPKLPRTWNRAIPPDLETIVLKAMAKDARERYATAQELADDLRRFVEDQPIRARRMSLWQRTRKWSRRHRAVVTTAAVVTICALLVGAGLLWRERNQTLASLEREMEQRLLAQENAAEAQAQRKLAQVEAERAEAQRQLAQAEAERAEANFQQARQAVDNYFTTVSEGVLFNVSGSQQLRQELLQSAVEYYETFVKQHADDPEIQVELAAAHFRLAHVYFSTKSGKWIDHARRSVELVDLVSHNRADTPQWTSLRKGLWRYLASDESTLFYSDHLDLGFANSRPLEAIEVTENAIRLWERLVQENPDVAGFENDVAGWHALRGHFLQLHSLGRKSEAVDSFRHAIQIYDGLVRKFPQEEAYRYTLCHSHRMLSTLLFESSSPEEAAKEFGIAAQILRELQSEHPDVVKYRAASDYLYGPAISVLPQWRDLPASSKELAGPLLKDFIIYVDGRTDSAVSLQECNWVADNAISLAWFLCNSADPQFRDPERAVQLATKAIDLAPRNAALWYISGEAHYRAGQWHAAIEALTKAIAFSPDPSLEKTRYAGLFLAMSEWQLGDTAKAREAFDATVERMNGRAPDDEQWGRFQNEMGELVGADAH